MDQSGQQPTAGYTAHDLTTRARIRDAALAEFAQHGFRGASIRGIAQAAGVSPGLVQHYFGSKDRLREECDAYVMTTMQEIKDQVIRKGAVADPTLIAAQFGVMTPLVDYMMASLTSGSEAFAAWFDDVTEYTYQVLTSGDIGPQLPESEETRAIAAVQAAQALGVTMLFDHLRRVVGPELDKSEALVRIGRARLFLTSDRVLGDEIAAKMRAGMNQFQQRVESERGSTGTRDGK